MIRWVDYGAIGGDHRWLATIWMGVFDDDFDDQLPNQLIDKRTADGSIMVEMANPTIRDRAINAWLPSISLTI